MFDGRRIVAVDFDGVIHRYSKGYYTGDIYDIPTPGVRDFLTRLRDNDYFIYIFSARLIDSSTVESGKITIQNWMEKHDLPYDKIGCVKIPAIAYVDDRAVPVRHNPINGVAWNSIFFEVIRLANRDSLDDEAIARKMEADKEMREDIELLDELDR
jgi:hypothetical protein